MLSKARLLMLVGVGCWLEVLASTSADVVTFEVLSRQVVGVDPSAAQTILQLDACAAVRLESMTGEHIGKVLRVTLDGTEITRAMVQAEIRGGRIVFVLKNERVASALSGKPRIGTERGPNKCQ